MVVRVRVVPSAPSAANTHEAPTYSTCIASCTPAVPCQPPPVSTPPPHNSVFPIYYERISRLHQKNQTQTWTHTAVCPRYRQCPLQRNKTHIILHHNKQPDFTPESIKMLSFRATPQQQKRLPSPTLPQDTRRFHEDRNKTARPTTSVAVKT